jgi:hypothetical protein
VALEVPRSQILERLDCPPFSEPSGRVIRQIEKAITWLRDHAEPRVEHRSYAMAVEGGLVRIETGTTLKSRKLAQSLGWCETIHVFLTTLGRKVDHVIDRTMRRRPAFGVVVDAVASVAADAMVDQFAEDLSERLPPGESLSLPFSPGHCDWAVEEQRKIFSLLPERPAGTVLSEDLMMTPRKSVSGVLGEGPETELSEVAIPCATCARANCSHRRCPYRRNQ